MDSYDSQHLQKAPPLSHVPKTVCALRTQVCTLSVAGGELASFGITAAAGGGGAGGAAGTAGGAKGLPPFDALVVDEAAQVGCSVFARCVFCTPCVLQLFHGMSTLTHHTWL